MTRATGLGAGRTGHADTGTGAGGTGNLGTGTTPGPGTVLAPATPGEVTRYGPLAGTAATEAVTYDVAIIGAGVVGTAIARELARHRRLRIALVEASGDVGDGTSKANTAILHTGFDAAPGTLEARLVREGHRLLGAYAAECGIPVEPVGALLVAWDEVQFAALPGLAAKAARNGYDAARLIDAEELYAREPHLGPGALGALAVPDESIICPFTTPLAYATQAVRAGVDLHLNSRVQKVTWGSGDSGNSEESGISGTSGGSGDFGNNFRDPGPMKGAGHTLQTERGPLHARWLVNAAGLHADSVDRMLGRTTFTVTPRRGQLVVFDKPARDLVRHILLPVPTALGKGVLVAPTVFGNVLLGPTAEDLDDKTASHSTEQGLASLRTQGARILPELLEEEVTTVYAGLRAATEEEDYRIDSWAEQRCVTVGGIRSTGLTASLAIAAHVAGLLAEAGLDLGPPTNLPPVHMPNLGERFPRPYQDAKRIAADPDYGRIVCHCERVTLGEIRDALGSTVPPAGVEGLRRRTRARAGRCQGFHCGAGLRALLDEDELSGRSGELRVS